MNKRIPYKIPEAIQKSKQGLKVKPLQTPCKRQEQSHPKSNDLTKNKTNPQDQKAKAKAKEMLEYLQNLRLY